MSSFLAAAPAASVTSHQGYTRLLKVLGSNVAEFLQNLNDLHLHLQYCWPEMLAPAFRCEQVCVCVLQRCRFAHDSTAL